MLTNKYIIASFARSYDKFHVANKIIHLSGSIFYNYLDYTYLLSNFKASNLYIIRLINITDNSFNIVELNDNVVEYQF